MQLQEAAYMVGGEGGTEEPAPRMGTGQDVSHLALGLEGHQEDLKLTPAATALVQDPHVNTAVDRKAIWCLSWAYCVHGTHMLFYIYGLT